MQTLMVFVGLTMSDHTIESNVPTRSMPSVSMLAFSGDKMPREALLKAKYPCRERFPCGDDNDGDDIIFDDMPCVADDQAAFRNSL